MNIAPCPVFAGRGAKFWLQVRLIGIIRSRIRRLIRRGEEILLNSTSTSGKVWEGQ